MIALQNAIVVSKSRILDEIYNLHSRIQEETDKNKLNHYDEPEYNYALVENLEKQIDVLREIVSYLELVEEKITTLKNLVAKAKELE